MRQLRPSLIVVIAVCALVGGMLGGALTSASAQTAPTVGVETFDVQPDANGYVTLPAGADDGLLSIACTGSWPLGGTNVIPTQVPTNVRSTTTRMRVWNHLGQPVRAPADVFVNCAEAFGTPAAMASFQAKTPNRPHG
jgi:hypothetical protein